MSDSKTIQIEGGVPLVGSVRVSGSRSLAVKLIYASILSGETCTLTNIPKAKYVLDDLGVAQELGVEVLWSGPNKLTINSPNLSSFVIPAESGSKTATAGFLVPALVHKFGKAVLPKSSNSNLKHDRGVQYSKIWQSLGMEVKEDLENYYIEAVKLQSGEIVLPYKSRVLTDLAILSSLFVLGESSILNASMDVETDDLIDFCTKIGGNVSRLEGNVISVNGCGVFKGVDYSCAFDREEATFFIVSALLTCGNMTLLDIDRARLLPFISWLSKVGANYEFTGSDMRVWHNSGGLFEKTEINVLPHPGFITDFAPFAVLLGCFAEGQSVITENLLATNLAYINDLNRLGARISVTRGVENIEIISYGPVKFKPGKLTADDLRYALVELAGALSIEGTNELASFDVVEDGLDGILDKLRALGGSIINEL